MTKRIINFLINFLLIIIFVFIFIYSNIVKQTIIYGINIWLYNLLPTIFPFLLVTKLLIYNNTFININNTNIITILSLLTGFPTGAIYIKELLNSSNISIEDANRLIMYTSFSSPIFVISIVGDTLLKSRILGVYIYIIHIITGLLIKIVVNKDYSIKSNSNKKEKQNNILIKAINESFEVLVNILGIIIFFLIIISIINTLLPNNLIFIILKSILELTTGIINISKYNINIKLKVSIIGALLSFNGLSVHYQVKSVINDTSIKYKNYLYARIIHAVLSFIFIYILYDILI